MKGLDLYINLIRQADFERLEDVRDQVSFSEIGPLIEAFSTSETWDQKAALIHLLQDQGDPRLRPIMLDFLKAPTTLTDDNIILTKAIAICYLDGSSANFMRYYNDTRLIQPRADQILRSRPNIQDPPHLPEIPAADPFFPKMRTVLPGIALTAILVGLALLAYRAINRHTLDQYRQHGVAVQARVTGKWKEDNAPCLGVSYFDKALLEGGQLYLTEICQFIPILIWDSLQTDSHVQVVYLTTDPGNNTILSASLDDYNLASINRIPIGGILLGLGAAVLFGTIIIRRLN